MFQKRKTGRGSRKLVAAIAAGALILSSTGVVYAEGYTDYGKKSLDQAAASIKAYLDMAKEQYEKSGGNGASDISLKLGEGGYSLLAALVPMDFSWLKEIGLSMNVAIKDGMENVSMELLLNSVALTTMEMCIDMGEMTEYLAFPELAEGVIKLPLTTETTEGEAADMSKISALLEDPMSVYPDGDVAEELVDRYGEILLSYATETESKEEALTAEGVSEDCTVYEAVLTQEELPDLLQEILSTAKEDQQLHDLVQTWSDLIAAEPGEEDLYTQFTEAIDSGLEDLEDVRNREEEAGGAAALYSKIWVDADGNIRGREFGAETQAAQTPFVTVKKPYSDGASALYMEMGDDSSKATLSGQGTVTEGKLSGEYLLSLDGAETVAIQVENYDVKAAKEGNLNGSYAFSFLPGNQTEESPYAMFAGLSLTLELHNDMEAGESFVEIGLAGGEETLLTLSVTGGFGEEGETEDLSEAEKLVDGSDSGEMESFMKEVKWDVLFEKLDEAGVPQELLEQILNMDQKEMQK